MKFYYDRIMTIIRTSTPRMVLIIAGIILTAAVLTGCGRQPEKIFPGFTVWPSDSSGITFQNTLTDTDTLNILSYLYYYNGGGVAIGDLDNDGLADIYLVSNQGPNKLYRNKGNMQFDDRTATAGVAGKGNWKTGVTLVDINNDGLLDIYVCEVGGYLNLTGRNELFINKGHLQFEEQAHAYGLDIEGFNTQAVFFDYDRDGDLDMFLVNHSVHEPGNFQAASFIRNIHSEVSGDKLFRNDNGPNGRHFTEVTAAAGIYSSSIGYGLNAAVGDLDNDGWPDIYVSNDFHENDYYYHNNRHGGFEEINSTAFGHESRFSMGSAIADLNNDGWLDIITLDMLPEKEKVLKSSAGDDAYDIYNLKYQMGYHYQNSRNCLQLNTGKGITFSEIGLYAGMAATDWSWSPIVGDFDNDGIPDLFVSNGIVRRPNDLDFLKFKADSVNRSANHRFDLAAIHSMPEGKQLNYLYKGTPNLRFIDKTAEWGIAAPTVSTGAACADLDNDGDLDIVVNNVNAEALVYKNQTRQTVGVSGTHFLKIRLQGSPSNLSGIGARVDLTVKNSLQIREMQASTGFESSSLQNLHFGMGNDTVAGHLHIAWPDGAFQDLYGVRADQTITLFYKEAEKQPVHTSSGKPIKGINYFSDGTSSSALSFRHQEDVFNDFAAQPLIPRLLSTQGPKIAVGDINGDGLEDFFICGARHQPGALFLQTKEGKFIASPQSAFMKDREGEGVSALFFDADNDGDLDLYVVTGGNETSYQDSSLLDRLYLNDGKGGFSRSTDLPAFYGNKSVVVAADFDQDGDSDLFIGGRVVAGSYGLTPESYLLLNDGHGRFTLADEVLAPGLRKIGMVTGAAWADLDGDGWQDLVLAGEWMPITVFKNDKGRLRNATKEWGLDETTGLWNSLSIADIDQDGKMDLLAGNLGLNSKLIATPAKPLCMYLMDYNHNGMIKQLLACARDSSYYTFLGKEELEKQLPGLRKRFLRYSSMAGQSIGEIWPELADHAQVLKADMLASMLFLNKGKQGFSGQQLPFDSQLAPIFCFLAGDYNRNGRTDLLTGGNFFGVNPYEGRYDAMAISLSTDHGQGRFNTSDKASTLPSVKGEVRDLKHIRLAGNKDAVLIARNNDSILLWQYK